MRIPIVDENDNVITYKDRAERLPSEITRVAALWVGNDKGEVLLAQRAFTKKDSPGLWGPAVAGSVEEGETYESNIIKEAEEEIGLKNFELVLGPKIRRSGTHQYFAQVFFTIISKDYPLVKQDSEVEALRWFTKEEFYKTIKEKPEIFLKSTENYTDEFYKYYESQNKKDR